MEENINNENQAVMGKDYKDQIARDQSQIISMLRITAIEQILIEKELVTRKELEDLFDKLNNSFTNSLEAYAKSVNQKSN